MTRRECDRIAQHRDGNVGIRVADGQVIADQLVFQRHRQDRQRFDQRLQIVRCRASDQLSKDHRYRQGENPGCGRGSSHGIIVEQTSYPEENNQKQAEILRYLTQSLDDQVVSASKIKNTINEFLK